MNRKTFNSLLLNMLDTLEITMENFYYKITEEKGQKTIDYGYNKSIEEGWILCNDLIGQYCGENYLQNGELRTIKIRVFHPFKMSKSYHSYLSLNSSVVVSIKPVLKNKASAIDEMCHLMAMGHEIEFNLNSKIN